ncbi:DUF695 domain-containing protein [Paenibacillus aurantiacus]|uniref:DUF695 domain-containing protein n=1 Tax=Paenibacillus aurantiacus TaxID=1936118 RepID=A0ABV5KT36_9BACL
MTDEWGFYERLTESEQMRILVNIGYKSEMPLAEYSDLLSVTLNLYTVRQTTKTKKALIAQLELFESKLEKWASGTIGAKYVGRINTSTRLEFYYYIPKGGFSKDAFNEWMQQEWAFRAQPYVKDDAVWEFYSFLLPNRLEELFVHNAHMIYALLHKGDNIGQPRNVYHWLLFAQAEDRTAVEPTLRQLGYRIEKDRAGEPDTGYPFPLVISRFDDVKLDTVNERVRELYSVISDYDSRYDGWGSTMHISSAGRFRQNVRRLLNTTLRIFHPGRR